jgi:ribonuclease VapC
MNCRATEIFVDASALLAILLKEPDGRHFSEEMERSQRLCTSPVAVYEMVSAIMRVNRWPLREARARVQAAIDTAEIDVIPITREIGELALEAFERYGKGRHRAALNMGDCFSYACAQSLRMRLLYKGVDFAHTDLA